MKQRVAFVSILIVLLVLVMGPLYTHFINKIIPDSSPQSDFSLKTNNYIAKTVSFGQTSFYVKLADTDAKRTQGLSNIRSMNANEGLMFVFPTPTKPSFWMKDMHFALDFVCARDGKVVDVLENFTPDTYPETYTPKENVDTCIELRAGSIERAGIVLGDLVSIE